MVCPFSPEGTGLPELPELPLLILNDSVALSTHEPDPLVHMIAELAEKSRCQALLLDFQKKGIAAQQALASRLCQSLSCPVGVSEAYAQQTEGPVFLPMLPAHRYLKHYLEPWQGRELWLELGAGAEQALVTREGTVFSVPEGSIPPCPLVHRALHCHYGIYPEQDQIRFTLVRTREDLLSLTQEAEGLGVTRTVGLWQELAAR